jgi:hypothetical protein
MTLDRALQRRLLEKLESAYPAAVEIRTITEDESAMIRNLRYLAEHGLVTNTKSQEMSAKLVHASTITARGLDFLADDGGLTAMLGVVTVKLHADTIRDLIEAKIAASDLPTEEKKRLTNHLRELPGEALKTLTTRLVESGLDNLPNAIQTLKAMIGL